jgi:MFS family permease
MAQYIMVFLTPFYLQSVLHYAPMSVGLLMSSFPLAVILVAPWSGALSDRVGTTKLAFVGAALCAVALLLLSRLGDGPTTADIVWRLVLFGLGTGLFQSPNNSAVMGSAPRAHLGVASGVLSTMRNIGMVLGIATGGAVLYASTPSHPFRGSLPQGADPAAFLKGLASAYIVGGVLTATASLLSLARGRAEEPG